MLEWLGLADPFGRVARRGYAATSIETIAKEAGVAVPTVYKAFGTKRAIALPLNARIDSEAGLSELVPAVLSSGSGRDVVAGSVAIGRRLCERTGDLISLVAQVAPSEPELAAVQAEGNRRAWSKAPVPQSRGLQNWVHFARICRRGEPPAS